MIQHNKIIYTIYYKYTNISNFFKLINIKSKINILVKSPSFHSQKLSAFFKFKAAGFKILLPVF